jgi:hypothetical protein
MIKTLLWRTGRHIQRADGVRQRLILLSCSVYSANHFRPFTHSLNTERKKIF